MSTLFPSSLSFHSCPVLLSNAGIPSSTKVPHGRRQTSLDHVPSLWSRILPGRLAAGLHSAHLPIPALGYALVTEFPCLSPFLIFRSLGTATTLTWQLPEALVGVAEGKGQGIREGRESEPAAENQSSTFLFYFLGLPFKQGKQNPSQESIPLFLTYQLKAAFKSRWVLCFLTPIHG